MLKVGVPEAVDPDLHHLLPDGIRLGDHSLEPHNRRRS